MIQLDKIETVLSFVNIQNGLNMQIIALVASFKGKVIFENITEISSRECIGIMIIKYKFIFPDMETYFIFNEVFKEIIKTQ